MPVLNWIGKDKVVNHDKELPFRVLKSVKELSVGEDNNNLLIEGDNLEALKALMPFYYNQIKCIYIDPPYNTGNETWIYNDKVNSPQIKAWLNKIVGFEGEDLCRHDKWLCMMFPRIKLLHQLLRNDGAIFISIDENEVHHLRLLLNEIFGEQNFVTQISWRKKKQISSDNKGFSSKVEYVMVYAKSPTFFPNKLPLQESYKENSFGNSNNDPKGPWQSVAITTSKGHQGGGYKYEIKTPNGTSIMRTWLYPKESYNRLEKENRLWFGKNNNSVPRRIMYLSEQLGQVPDNLWLDIATNRDGRNEISAIFEKNLFDTPKPTNLIRQIVRIGCSNNSDIILDSFAGSGTTGQAVLELNKEDGGNRQFILVELERNIAKDVTAKRLKKVIEGYEEAKFPNGTGGGFKYLDLNGVLYDYSGYVNPDAKYEDMAAYIYFTETQNYLDITTIKNPYIGSQSSTHYFLFFKGKGNNILDDRTLKQTDGYKGNKVIYADKCLIDEEQLTKRGVVFKQIPYELKKY